MPTMQELLVGEILRSHRSARGSSGRGLFATIDRSGHGRRGRAGNIPPSRIAGRRGSPRLIASMPCREAASLKS